MPSITTPRPKWMTSTPKPTSPTDLTPGNVALPAALSILGVILLFFMVFTTKCRTRSRMNALRGRNNAIPSISGDVPMSTSGGGRDPAVDAPPSYDDVIKDTDCTIFRQNTVSLTTSTDDAPEGIPPPTYLDSLAAELIDARPCSDNDTSVTGAARASDHPIPGTSSGPMTTIRAGDVLDDDDSVFHDDVSQGSYSATDSVRGHICSTIPQDSVYTESESMGGLDTRHNCRDEPSLQPSDDSSMSESPITVTPL